MSSQKLLILTYHRVLVGEQRDFLDEIDEAQFRLHVDVFSKYFNVLSLSEAIGLLDTQQLPPRAISITFDDGYRDNVDVALPILYDKRVPATFFVATKYLNGGIMWNDIVRQCVHSAPGRRLDLRPLHLGQYPIETTAERIQSADSLIRQIKYLPQDDRNTLCENICQHLDVHPATDLMMRTSDLITLKDAGMEIGAHTRSHPILSAMEDSVAREEISGSKKDLEMMLSQNVGSFAYPNGRRGQDFKQKHVEMVREAGFRLAVSTESESATPESDRFQLGRFSVWHRSRIKLILRLLLNYFKQSPAAE